ncbi:hypothetical protein I5677_04120 [Mobilitalea sibirica]|uniref:Alcohol acetyltransferase n=1 Tax=Mobilitalea sibirica TaxID=1462919 RepID=A0A8J7H5E4_9FIRM|nr:hypothetical protein [Mobilitalea sibirica]MBH1940081.1 hypothetical protein [Mobilitalea sibirica]
MTKKMPVEWTRLDNAAKIFPPTTNEKDTKVFRFVCELKDDIEQKSLQEALDKTMVLFPFYRSVLRRGVFWYYFESTDIKPVVMEEHKLPCSMLYHHNRRNLLFEVTYYKKRINLEVYHSLTDGTGALGFLKTLLYYYIIIKYKEDFGDKLPTLDYDASISQKMDDSFLKNYNGDQIPKRFKLTKAYHIMGRRSIDNRLKVIEGVMPVKEVIDLAHRYDTTMTIYLTALFLKAIHQEMPLRSRRYPVVLSVPVNLRTYFPSVTARNFFTTINIRYNFSKMGDDLEDILKEVKEGFARELTQDKLREHMNRLSALEHNAFMRVVPLFLKDVVLRFANFLNDRGITAALSNVGKVNVTEELSTYIHMFDCFTSAKRPQICICSFGNNLVISFASPFVGTDIQKNFFRMLSQEGISITVASNTKEV